MVGQICSLAKNSIAAVPLGSSAKSESHTKSNPVDDDLIALCQNFRAKLHAWIIKVGKQGTESYDENSEPGRALLALRMDWGKSLAAARSLVPHTVPGATEKLLAAQDFVTFSCEADGSALEFLALATSEFNQVKGVHSTSNETETSRGSSASGPFWWLGRLTRRA